jgi:hypothetical protein
MSDLSTHTGRVLSLTIALQTDSTRNFRRICHPPSRFPDRHTARVTQAKTTHVTKTLDHLAHGKKFLHRWRPPSCTASRILNQKEIASNHLLYRHLEGELDEDHVFLLQFP